MENEEELFKIKNEYNKYTLMSMKDIIDQFSEIKDKYSSQLRELKNYRRKMIAHMTNKKYSIFFESLEPIIIDLKSLIDVFIAKYKNCNASFSMSSYNDLSFLFKTAKNSQRAKNSEEKP